MPVVVRNISFFENVIQVHKDDDEGEEEEEEDKDKEEPDPILDLTSFLTTGRASEALAEFLGSGQDMSERVCAYPFRK